MKFKEYKGLDLAQTAADVLGEWDARDTFHKSITTREGHPAFVFYEGPPSANGTPGIHHVMARTIKDVFCRYKTQQGYLVHRKAGWDTHGLPVELGVEKKLGITKEDIGKKITIEEYNRTCREAVMEFTGMWEDLTRKMGYWVNMDDPYITYDNKYIETLWWLLKQLFDKGLLYKGYTIQPYSPAAGTGLSTHELNQPGCYRDVKDTTCTAQFEVIRDQKSEKLFAGVEGPLYFLAWTTTPWTLPSNTALAVGPAIEYVKVKCRNPYTDRPQTVILAKELVPAYFTKKMEGTYEITGESWQGPELEGIRYEQLIPWVKPEGDAFRVIVGDYVTTSGTLGDPVTFALTEEDLDRLAYNEAESFTTAGCTPEDVLQLMTTIDRRFMAGLAYFLGARKLRCGVIRVGNGIPELQWDTIRRIGPTGCIVVPSFLTKLVAYAEEHGIDYRRSSLRRAICIGEALRDTAFGNNTLGAKITELWPELELFSTYASTEMQTSITECGHHCGGHVPADLILVELLDEQNNPVAEGEEGEVVITTLGGRGMPLLRFRTGDICIGYTERCACGRSTMRLSSVIGRKGQMIKFKGTTLYPPALYDILENIPGVSNYIIEVFTGSLGTDQIVLRIGSARRDEAFEKEIKDTFRSKVRVAPEGGFETVEYIAKKQMPQMSRKQIKFVDLREQTK